ncbi:sal-like protein 1 [Scaptodrosophila lebanonensis]|uniref:Sal-like protein 1 n=1 Tax=Drosophila lebanonensis TaxID=7225 RepID=A0A6J2UF84_DROLE|nr:sal-like protein 1 [Scaptodrosophila lebanonensis]
MLPALHTHTAAHLDTLDNRDSGEAHQPQQQQKRSASMIFRIEQFLPSVTSTMTSNTTTTTAASVVVTQASKRQMGGSQRPGVYTAQYMPKDACSSCVPPASLLAVSSPPASGSNSRAYCALTDGQLLMSATLMRQLKLSEDIYSFNALFELHAGQVRVRIVRDVARDEEIVAWFGEELVLLMGIPFLTPLNIQGDNRYTCNLCHLTFSHPHPLKIHLALGCGHSAIDILWFRLHCALKAPQPSSVSHALTAIQHSPPHPASSASSISPTHTPPPPPPASVATTSLSAQRFSAFRPIATTLASLPGAQSLIGLPTITTSASLPYLTPISMSAPLMSLPSSNPINAAAQIEAIVSNMGASKQGHLCIYCGKVYSRKYGLKIHIRTHTGFKPLKCKFCLRPFGDPSNLNKHVRLHLQTNSPSSGAIDCGTGEPDTAGYQCQLCPRTLARRRDLQRHMETRHSGVQPERNTNTTRKDD